MAITKAEFARLTGVSPSNVSRWIRKGIIKPMKDGAIDLNQAIQDLKKNRDPVHRINWRIGAGKPLNPNVEGRPDWATGNLYRDLQVMTILHFHAWVTDEMTPILVKLIKAIHPRNDVLAEAITVMDSIKRGELVNEYLTKGIFEKKMGSLGDGIFPKNLEVQFPESIRELLKDRKVDQFVFGE